MGDKYKDLFRTAEAAETYDRSQYGEDSYWTLLWDLEKAELRSAMRSLRDMVGPISYLDFACGTGRVLAELEQYALEATGIDVSESMLKRAKDRGVQARLICRDITSPDAPLEGKYDLITAFRFVLNVDEDVRMAALHALAGRLRDRRSRLIVNVHGNRWSYKSITVPIRAWARPGKGHAEKVLSVGELGRILRAVGLEIVGIRGCGVLPGRVHRLIGPRLGLAVERVAVKARFIGRFGVNQIVTCRLRAS